MNPQKRLFLVNSHMTSKFPEGSYNDSIEEFRKQGRSINSEILIKNYFGDRLEPTRKIRQIVERSELFDHRFDFENTRDQERKKVLEKIAKVFFAMKMDSKLDDLSRYDMLLAVSEYDQALATRAIVHILLYLETLSWLGTEKHQEKLERAQSFLDIGCFAMTELGHGSNVSKIETRADFDPSTKEFVINSPTKTSAKWWIGGAAKTANMCCVFAQLYVEGVNRGVQVFLVPIRDYSTHEPMPGVVLGDIGKKISMEGVDNGFILFKNYRVPYNCLLDKYSYITADGKFKSSIKNNEKRLGVMMGGLYSGRISVVCGTEINYRLALTIAVRFSAARKQFGYSGKEVPILSYQLQKYRLVPHVSKLLGMRMASLVLFEMYNKVKPLAEQDPECEELSEFHGVLSCFKAICSWYGVEGVQTCREATGGLGYSAYSALGRIKANQDIHATWDGDNSVLIQQTAKYLLKQVQRTFKGVKISAQTLEFLEVNPDKVREFRASFSNKEELVTEKSLVELFEYRVNYVLHATILKLQENAGKASEMLEAWNNTQVHYVQDLSKAFGEMIITKKFFEWTKTLTEQCTETGATLLKFAQLYSLERVEKTLGVFQEEALSKDQAWMIKEKVVELCEELGEASLKVLDALAPSDKTLGSAIGCSDGQIYSHMVDAVESCPQVYEKPQWTDIIFNIRKRAKKLNKQ